MSINLDIYNQHTNKGLIRLCSNEIWVYHLLMMQLNSKVTEIAKTLGVNEENDDSVGFLRICNPFSGPPNYTYVPQSCSNSGIPVGKLPEVSKL